MKWILYMRSPEVRLHRYGLEHLFNSNARSCFGHACHVLDVQKHIYKSKTSKSNRIGVWYGEKQDKQIRGAMPEEVARLLDIDILGTFRNPVKIDGLNYTSMVEVNDKTAFTTVKEVAQVLRDQYEADNFLRFGE